MEDRLQKMEEIAEKMGLEPSELAEKLASDMTQMQSHESRHPEGCVVSALDMLEDELGLPADDDTAEALLAFIDKHFKIDAMSRQAQAQFAKDLGERGEDYDLRYHESKMSKTR